MKDKQNDIYQSVLRELDKFENEAMPDVTLSKVSLSFDEQPIEYQKAYDDFITLKNKGSVMAQWKFVAKMDEKVLCKPWLFVSPNAGLLMPGPFDLFFIKPAAIMLMRMNRRGSTHCFLDLC